MLLPRVRVWERSEVSVCGLLQRLHPRGQLLYGLVVHRLCSPGDLEGLVGEGRLCLDCLMKQHAARMVLDVLLLLLLLLLLPLLVKVQRVLLRKGTEGWDGQVGETGQSGAKGEERARGGLG